ncbi:ABC-2 type transport system permease protein [Caldanaerovirga acetigignens]|uniref:ABC-2 type transport system permease protein n=1 Tax=Caldanaerovirga acetigignens TaxID=447595 RepID=A0A1M7JY09_9FIRM|nr:ABC transporter permease [Caldanaerovirga acetigignens]SHM57940.1 ABC-2 type transport system permease protein [Caldanaerovirga acetigignens]
MRRILNIFKRDLSGSLRDSLLLYMTVAPVILALVLRFFITGADAAALQFAVYKNVEGKVIEELRKYGTVEVFEDKEGVEKRIWGPDDVAGIIKVGNDYRIILEGNESGDTKELSQMIMKDILYPKDIGVNFVVKDLGRKNSLVAVVEAASLFIMLFTLCGAVIGFNIIEEKESQTLSALSVTPMRGYEYIIGKSLTGILLPLILGYILIWLLGIKNIDLGKLFVMTLCGTIIAVLVGFLVGSLSGNQIAGIANLKVLGIILSGSVVGALMLPESKQIFLYWIPTYWSFKGFYGIFIGNISWRQIIIYNAWVVGLSIFILSIIRRIPKLSYKGE